MRTFSKRRAFEAAEMRNYEIAMPLLQEILTFDLATDDRANALGNVGIIYFHRKEYQVARDYLLQALKLPQPPQWQGRIRLALGISYAYLNSLHDAKQELVLCEERAGEWVVSLPYVYDWLAMICKHLGEIEQSKQYARLARPD